MSSNKESNKNPLVSIVMPTHNRSDLFLESVHSVIAQTYSNWELIIVADDCTDDTSERIKPYLKDKRITFYESKTNLGGAGARNLGMDLISGEYVAFLDDDDVWLPKKTEMQLKFLQENAEISLVYCNFNQWFSNGSKKRIKMPASVSLEELLVLNVIGSFSFVMMRADQLKTTRIDSELRSAQDWDLWIRVLKNSKTLGLNCNMNLVDYRIQGQKKISINKESVSKGYEKWLSNHRHDMSQSLIDYHNIIVEIKKQYKVWRCVLLWSSYFLRNPLKPYFNILILKQIYSKI